MNKGELIDQVWHKTGLQKKDCAAALEAALAAIAEALGAGDDVKLVGFGTFEVKHRKERTGRNPKTKQPVLIPASKTPVFHPGKQLKDAANQSHTNG